MDAIELLARRLPAEADGIRRLFRRDREFRELCEDYRDCVAALERAEISRPARAEEYRELAAELLAEAMEMLRAGRP